jgi:hypothetical protein
MLRGYAAQHDINQSYPELTLFSNCGLSRQRDGWRRSIIYFIAEMRAKRFWVWLLDTARVFNL